MAGSYFNVGCGPNILPGFVNIVADWRPGVALCCDISAGLPLSAAVAGGVYTEHCLEHLPLAAARAFLTDCHRIMAPGACIRIVVPDLEMYARAYVATLDGAATKMPIVSPDRLATRFQSTRFEIVASPPTGAPAYRQVSQNE